MKKIMMAVALAVATFSLNAATVDWKTGATSKIYGVNSTTLLASGTAYFYENAGSTTMAAIVAAFAADASSIASSALATKTVSAGAISAGTFSWDKSGDRDAFIAVVAGDDLFISDVVTMAVADVGTTTYQFKEKTFSQADYVGTLSGGYTSAGWYQSVPEPTSGLLLLLGMAGLALKRKRA